MRTKHTYICVFCGKEQPKDWLYKGADDDHEAACKPCWDAQFEIEWCKDGRAGMHNKITGERWTILARLVNPN